ncbi:MAG: LysR family transcriptional regulator [Ilumatobacteraceae bacterium]|nr:LysR family transcriptional regulator [Ilumatobacteraceae bacterium]
MVALQQVLCLEEVVRTKSFRAAAAALNMSQPAVSGHIARLERELNLTLLDRTKSGSVLTPEGAQILPHLRAFVDTAEQIRRATEQIQHPAQQHLRVVGETRPIRMMIPDAITELSKTFEHVSVRIESTTEDVICSDLRSHHAELGVFAWEEGTSGLANEVEAITIFPIGPYGVSLPAGHHALEHPGPIAPIDLAGDHIIVMSEHKASDLVERLFTPEIRENVSTVDDVTVGLAMVERGFGVMLGSGVVSYITNQRLPWRAFVGAPSFTVCLGKLRGVPLSPVAQAFADYLQSWGRHCEETFRYNAETGCVEPADVVVKWFSDVTDAAVGVAPGDLDFRSSASAAGAHATDAAAVPAQSAQSGDESLAKFSK